MPISVAYAVSRNDRKRFAAEYDSLEKPATFEQQRAWALANPRAQALLVKRVFDGLMSHRAIADQHQYKYLRCKHIQRTGSCPLQDRCSFVHTEAYKAATVCYKRAHGQAIRPAPRVGERSASPVSSSPPPAPSPSPVEGLPPQEELPAPQTPEQAELAPSPIPAAVGAPLVDQPKQMGPRFGMPPVVIVDDAGLTSRYLPRDILFGIKVDLSWLPRV